MLDHAREAISLVDAKTETDFTESRLLQLGLVRLIEIIGEAAGRVSPETRHRFVDVPWQQIIGMRNRLIHGYDAIDLTVLWRTVTWSCPTSLRCSSDTWRKAPDAGRVLPACFPTCFPTLTPPGRRAKMPPCPAGKTVSARS